MRFLPHSRFGVVWRALLGGIVVIGFAAGATATYGLLQVKQLAVAIGSNPALKDPGTQLPAPGKPETLLLVGSDHRYGQSKGESNTDTMILVRVDDSSSTINLLSIPRDLAVTINGQTLKLNSAWSLGGPKLLIHTLRAQVFPQLAVNHVINIDFGGFAALINAIGGVYSMVDHRYYNDNSNPADIATDFSSIDLQPGYQRLTGGTGANGGPTSALAFVRYRHSDSDLLRETRQQDFLRWAKSQFSTSRLLAHESQLIDTLGKHIATDRDLHTTDGLLELADLLINANGHQIKSLRFPVTGEPVIGGADYVVSSPAATAKIYRKFMAPTEPGSQPPPKHRRNRSSARHPTLKIPPGMSADPRDGRTQAGELGPMSFPIYYPKYIPTRASYCFSSSTHTGSSNDCALGFEPAAAYTRSYPRRYRINGPGAHEQHAAYVMTLTYPNLQDVFLNVQGTTWMNPPLLRHPTKVQTVGGRRLAEYYNGAGNLSVVAWRTKQAVYWIANTLQDVVPPAQMIAMAATLTRG